MQRLLLAIGTAIVLAVGSGASNQAMGDPWRVADRMIETLGGRQRWASVRWLYVKETVYPAGIEGPVSAEFWRDLEQPNYRSVIVGPSLTIETRWSQDGGFVIRNGERREMSAEVLQQEIDGSRNDPYHIYHRLARRDPPLHLVLENDTRLNVFEGEGGPLLCWFVVDASGAPLRWGNYFDGEVNEHVYGPLRELGEFTMPAWGTSTTGSWRFEYEEARVTSGPP
jgi:hypothetical protein